MLNQKILCAAIAAVFATGAAQARPGQPKAHVVVAHGPASLRSVPAPSGAGTLLYDQFANATATGVDSEDSSSDQFDDQGADDFVVPASGWQVNQVRFRAFAFDATGNGGGTGTGFPANVNVFVYPNASGQPGATPTCSYSAIADPYDQATGLVTVTLPTLCVLTAGTYWISMQAIGDFATTGNGYAWAGSTPAVGAGALWQNPGNGYETGCTTWSAVGSCSTGADPDFAFQIYGNVTTPVSLQSYSVE